MKKQRYFRLVYWFKTTKIDTEAPFKNYSAAFGSIYKDGDNKLISVKFIGWK